MTAALVDCPACGGEGRLFEPVLECCGAFDPDTGECCKAPYVIDHIYVHCPECDCSGQVAAEAAEARADADDDRAHAWRERRDEDRGE